jgi:hypothetical protein
MLVVLAQLCEAGGIHIPEAQERILVSLSHCPTARPAPASLSHLPLIAIVLVDGQFLCSRHPCSSALHIEAIELPALRSGEVHKTRTSEHSTPCLPFPLAFLHRHTLPSVCWAAQC